jgi:hypothetical protein
MLVAVKELAVVLLFGLTIVVGMWWWMYFGNWTPGPGPKRAPAATDAESLRARFGLAKALRMAYNPKPSQMAILNTVLPTFRVTQTGVSVGLFLF